VGEVSERKVEHTPQNLPTSTRPKHFAQEPFS
jgi:hypothetical protein